MERQLTAHEARLSRIEERTIATEEMIRQQFEALNKRFDEVVCTQLRDHGKRIQRLEDGLSEFRRGYAEDKGQLSGGWKAIVAFGSILGFLIGIFAPRVIQQLGGQ